MKTHPTHRRLKGKNPKWDNRLKNGFPRLSQDKTEIATTNPIAPQEDVKRTIAILTEPEVMPNGLDSVEVPIAPITIDAPSILRIHAGAPKRRIGLVGGIAMRREGKTIFSWASIMPETQDYTLVKCNTTRRCQIDSGSTILGVRGDS